MISVLLIILRAATMLTDAQLMKIAQGEKQKRILEYMLKNRHQGVSLDNIVSNCKVSTAYNTKRYLSATMTTMVNKGIIFRIKPGVFMVAK